MAGGKPCVFCWNAYPVGFSRQPGPKVSKGERREARAQWAQPPKAVSDRSFRQITSGAHGSAGRADCLPRGKPPAFLPEYLYPVGFFANYGPKVSKGERREAGIQWIQPPKAVSDRSFRQITSGAHGSAGRADCLPRGKPPVRPQAQTLAPVGLDAPTPARGQGLQPYGALTLFFRWRKKSVQKKASGTATLAARPAARRGLRSAVAPSGLSSTSVRFAHPSGKKPFIAHF